MMFVPHRKHTYGPPRPLMKIALLSIYRWCSYLTGNTLMGLHGLLQDLFTLFYNLPLSSSWTYLGPSGGSRHRTANIPPPLSSHQQVGIATIFNLWSSTGADICQEGGKGEIVIVVLGNSRWEHYQQFHPSPTLSLPDFSHGFLFALFLNRLEWVRKIFLFIFLSRFPVSTSQLYVPVSGSVCRLLPRLCYLLTHREFRKSDVIAGTSRYVRSENEHYIIIRTWISSAFGLTGKLYIKHNYNHKGF
jgi:hypothetical protein